MGENRDRLDEALQALRESVRTLEARVAALEAGRTAEATAGAVPAAESRAAAEPSAEAVLPRPALGGTGLSAGLSLTGTTFLILGGAFLLRAVTEGGILPAAAGVYLGFAYSLLWTLIAGRAASRGRTTPAAFRTVAAALMAYPLLWEATARFGVFTTGTGTAATAVVTAIALGVAWRAGSAFLAGVFTVAAAAITILFLFAAETGVAQTVLLVLLGIASLWLAYERGWSGHRWLVAIVGDLAVARLVVASLHAREAAEATSVLPLAQWIALGLLLAYLGSFALHTLVRRREIGAFEVFQSAAALVVGLGGAARIARAEGSGTLALGLCAMLAGAACYAVAFLFLRRRAGRSRNFFFYSTLGLGLVLAGCRLTGGTGLCTLTCGVLTVGAAFVGGRFDRVTIRAHAAAFAVAAAFISGLFPVSLDVLTGEVGKGWRQAPWAPAALALTLIAYATLVATRAYRTAPRLARAPRTVLAVLSLLGIAAVAVVLVTTFLARGGGAPEAGAVAAVRSAVLAVGAVTLAALRRQIRLPELGWLTWLLLGLGAVKLVLEDLRAGGAGPLFLAFAFYGLALVVAPRLLRTTSSGG